MPQLLKILRVRGGQEFSLKQDTLTLVEHFRRGDRRNAKNWETEKRGTKYQPLGMHSHAI